MKKRAADHGRDPDQLLILPAATTVVGTDVRDAMAKHEAFFELVDPMAGLSRLAYHVNVDLTKYDLDGPLPSLEVVGVEGHYREVVEFAEREKLSVREIGRWYGARTEGNMIGSAADIADTMEQWMDSRRRRRLHDPGHPRAGGLRGLRGRGRARAAAPRAVPHRPTRARPCARTSACGVPSAASGATGPRPRWPSAGRPR